MSAVNYRQDIDGLRAVAVGSVLLAHSEISRHVAGGYVGVDIFFVISGFLISSIILNQIVPGRLSFLEFYQRRIARIVPALLVVIVVTALASYFVLLPTEFDEFAKSAISAILSVSNIYFWGSSGYFDAPALTKPLLHTWSLGIEEQFYLIFPVLLFFAARRRKNGPRLVIYFVFCASLALSAVWVYLDRSSAFYLLPTRAWELALGAIVSLDRDRVVLGARGRNIVSLLALAAIGLCVVLYKDTSPFPGILALPPTLAAAALIVVGGQGSIGSTFLSARPLVSLGLISYSLYLWHWPIFVMYRIDTRLPHFHNEKWASGLLIAVSIVVAFLSWKFVEGPTRSLLSKIRASSAVKIGFGSSAIVSAGLLTIVVLGGVPQRFPDDAVTYAKYLKYSADVHNRQGVCFITSKDKITDFNEESCVRGRRDFLIVGDSHAAHLYHGFADTFGAGRIGQVTASGCKPVISGGRGESRCTALMKRAFERYIPESGATVILAARWKNSDLPRVRETLAWAREQNIKVVLVGPIPQYKVALPRLLAVEGSTWSSRIQENKVQGLGSLDREMKELALSQRAKYVSLQNLLCDDRQCTTLAAPGIPLQFDYGHLTAEGSIEVARRIRASGALH